MQLRELKSLFCGGSAVAVNQWTACCAVGNGELASVRAACSKALRQPVLVLSREGEKVVVVFFIFLPSPAADVLTLVAEIKKLCYLVFTVPLLLIKTEG